jgi:DNA (cytosine-5)-methyltransferase 1
VSKLPRKEPGDDSIWILWASLECTHFSNAKTGSRDADSRTLAHALYPYIHHINPDLIKIENVREFMSWGPLTAKVIKRRADVGDHCPITYDKTTGKFGPHFVPESRTKGRDYLKWRQTIESFGYRYKSKLLNSADFGAYQARLRYFGVFAKPGLPITFPTPTNDKHGRHGLPRWRAVRDVLELHEVGQSIFTRKKPLSPKTLERVLAGLLKFVKPEIDKAGVTASYLVSNYSGKPESRAWRTFWATTSTPTRLSPHNT